MSYLVTAFPIFSLSLKFGIKRIPRFAIKRIPVNKNKKAKENVADNQFHSILRLFDVLVNFPFTTSETMCGYYLQTWYLRVPSGVTERLKILGN